MLHVMVTPQDLLLRLAVWLWHYHHYVGDPTLQSIVLIEEELI